MRTSYFHKRLMDRAITRKRKEQRINHNVYRALIATFGESKGRKIRNFCIKHAHLSQEGQKTLAIREFGIVTGRVQPSITEEAAPWQVEMSQRKKIA